MRFIFVNIEYEKTISVGKQQALLNYSEMFNKKIRYRVLNQFASHSKSRRVFDHMS